MKASEQNSLIDSFFSINKDQAVLSSLNFEKEQRACLAIECQNARQELKTLILYKGVFETLSASKRHDIYNVALNVLSLSKSSESPASRSEHLEGFSESSLFSAQEQIKAVDTNQSDYQWCEQIAKEVFKKEITLANADPAFSTKMNGSSGCIWAILCSGLIALFTRCAAAIGRWLHAIKQKQAIKQLSQLPQF